MLEQADDLERLDALLARSIASAGPALRRSLRMPEHSLSAAALVARLPGSLIGALATVTARGEPRVAPVSAMFIRGRFCVPTVAEAARARHLARRPAASLSYHEGTELAVIVHGHAERIAHDHPSFEAIDAVRSAAGESSVTEWAGTGVYLRIEPATMFTYAARLAAQR